jgi:GNAT superfamily N-acetyltransferase
VIRHLREPAIAFRNKRHSSILAEAAWISFAGHHSFRYDPYLMTGDVNNPSRYAVDETLRDGGLIHLRAIAPDDRERLIEHFQNLSEESVYYRFFGLKHRLSDPELAQLTELDFVNHVGLVATLYRDGGEHFIGVARYIRSNDLKRAEVAFAVTDVHHGRGIATLLLNHLGRIARAAGIEIFEAVVLTDNSKMLEVFDHSGFGVSRTADNGTTRVTMRLEPGQTDAAG